MRKFFDHFYITDEKDFILSRHTDVHALLKNAYWAEQRDPLAMYTAIQNSLNYAVFETKLNRLVGFARIITDHATLYYLCDVFVDEAFRGMGLGKTLIEHILFNEKQINGLSGLLKTRDAKELYETYGFEECRSVCMVKNKIEP